MAGDDDIIPGGLPSNADNFMAMQTALMQQLLQDKKKPSSSSSEEDAFKKLEESRKSLTKATCGITTVDTEDVNVFMGGWISKYYFSSFVTLHPLFPLRLPLGEIPHLSRLTRNVRDQDLSAAYMYGKVRAQNLKASAGPGDYEMAMILECLGIGYPETPEYCLPMQQAKDKFCEDIIEYLKDWEVEPAAHLSASLGQPLKDAIIAAGKKDRAQITPEVGYYLLTIKAKEEKVPVVNGIIAGYTLLAAVTRKGMCTTGYLTKIQNGAANDGVQGVTLSAKTIENVWGVLKSFIDETNIRKVLSNILELLPSNALRSRLMVTQSPNEGLLGITSVMEAITTYPDFPWSLIFNKVPAEAQQVKEAIVLVSNNPFYGYARDIGPCRITMFPNIAYTAKQLHSLIGHKTGILESVTWKSLTDKVPYTKRIDALVAHYETRRDESFTWDTKASQNLDSIITIAIEGEEVRTHNFELNNKQVKVLKVE